MRTSGEIEAASIILEKLFAELELDIMRDVVRRMAANNNIITRSADWQLNVLSSFGASKERIRGLITDALGLSKAEVDRIYSDVIASGYARCKGLYDAVGAVFTPFEDNLGMRQLVAAMREQTQGALKNITQSMGFAVKDGGRLSFTPLADYYQSRLDKAVLDVTSGAFDYNTILKRTVAEMTNSGLRTVDYASGISARVPTAARRAVMTGANQVVARINESNARLLGTDTYEVSWHGGARPSHLAWQGGVYTHDELVSVCGLGSVTGLCGANCYHDYSPFLPGISEPTYTPEELEVMRREELLPIEYNGRQYTKYEAMQRQRDLERTMRAQRQEIKLLKDGGAEEGSIIDARCRYRGTSAEYSRFSKAMGIPEERERVTADGLGNIGKGTYISGGSKAKDFANVAEPKKATAKSQIINLGTIDTQPLEKEFGKLKTEEIIVTGERIEHIKLRHPEDFEMFEEFGISVLKFPDVIVKDTKNENTAFMIKKLGGTNLNVVVKLILAGDRGDYTNSVMTFYRIRNKNLEKLLKKHKILYIKE